MLIISGDVRNTIDLVDITEEEFSELPRISTIGNDTDAYTHLLRIFTENLNVILCAVWVERSLSEIYDFQVDYLSVKAYTATEVYEKLQQYTHTTFVVHTSEIEYTKRTGFKLSLVPLDSLKLPEESWVQMRKHFIDNILKDL